MATDRLPPPIQFSGWETLGVRFGVVHITDDVQDRPRREQGLIVVGVVVRPHPAVVVADAAQRLDLRAPNRLPAHPHSRGVQVRLEAHDLRMLGQDFVRM